MICNFYYKDESREKAEVKRDEATVYLRGMLERKSNFAVAARGEQGTVLSPVARVHALEVSLQ
jgi:hypothetical protein